MKRIKNLLFVLAICIPSPIQASALTPFTAVSTLTASEAKDHIGKKATVCGTVASTRYAAQSKGRPTFVKLDKPYPSQVFTIVIWAEDLPKFTDKPSNWENKQVCATGTITSYRGVPEIVAKSSDQITLTITNPYQATTPQTSPSRPTNDTPPAGAVDTKRDANGQKRTTFMTRMIAEGIRSRSLRGVKRMCRNNRV